MNNLFNLIAAFVLCSVEAFDFKYNTAYAAKYWPAYFGRKGSDKAFKAVGVYFYGRRDSFGRLIS